LIEWKLVLVPMLPPAVVFPLAIKRTVLALSEKDIDAGNATSGVSDAVGVGGVGGAASFSLIPKTNFSIAARAVYVSWY
jgi:hypothetical protein